MAARRLSWIGSARRAYEAFPEDVKIRVMRALFSIAAGGVPDAVKPLKGLEGGAFEIAIRYRRDAWRVVYALKLGDDIWIIHAFQKKSKSGIATPKAEIETIRQRIRALKAT